MIALPGKFRVKVYNGTGVALAAADLTVKVCFQKFSPEAAITESAVVTLFSTAGVANATYESGAWFDNTVTRYLGFHGLVYANVTGAPNGTIRVFLENTTDPAGATTSPSDGRGWMLIEMGFVAAGNTTRSVKV